MKEAADLKYLVEWLKHVNSKLMRKISLVDAQNMTVQEFCKKHGGKELYENCKEMWKDYLGRNFGK